jgi:hypothetical protein
METIDDETCDAAVDYIKRQVQAVFRCWVAESNGCLESGDRFGATMDYWAVPAKKSVMTTG